MWDLSVCRTLSRTNVPGHFGITALLILAPDRVAYANGFMLSLYAVVNPTAPLLTIEFDSEIQALAAHGPSTIVAATRLGLVVLEIPQRPELATTRPR